MIILLAAIAIFIYYIICLINPSRHKVGFLILSALFGFVDGIFGEEAKKFRDKK